MVGGALENLGLSVLPQPLCEPEDDCVLNWEGDLENGWLTANYCILIGCNVYYFILRILATYLSLSQCQCLKNPS